MTTLMNPAEVVEVEQKGGLVSQLVSYGVETYYKGKDVLVKQPTLGPRLGPWVNFGEEKLQAGLKLSPYPVDQVVHAVDNRLDKVVNYTVETKDSLAGRAARVAAAPAQLKDASLVYMHDKIKNLKVEKDNSESPEEIGVTTVLVEAKSVTAERLNQLLDASEGYLQQYLPPTHEEPEDTDEVITTEIRPTAVRAIKVSKVAAKRMQERALAKMTDLKLRTSNVVHVDLVKYSEWLDLEGKKAVVVVQLQKVDDKLVQPAKEAMINASNKVNEKLVAPVLARVTAIRVPFSDDILRVWTVIGDKYNEKVVQPRAQIIEMFREELALQQELAKQKNGDEPMTISAGMQAVVTAARARLSKEWEIRISPSLQRVMGKASTEEEEEEEDKSFGDAEEADDSE